MQINLSQEMSDHFERLKIIAEEAKDSEEESLSSRASALSACTALIKELVKVQSEVVNMERLMKVERVTISVLKKYLNEKQVDEFMSELTEMLNE